MGRRVLVTNSTTELGVLVIHALLARGDEPVGWVTSTPEEPIPGASYMEVIGEDSTEALRAVDLAEPEGVICLPPLQLVDDDDVKRDVRETRNLFHSLPAFTPAVFVSTGQVYGAPTELPCEEGDVPSPRTSLARARHQGELASLDLHPDTVVARPFVFVDPTPDKPPPASHLGLIRDLCDVRDVVGGLLLLLDRGIPGMIYNLCSGEGTPLSAVWQHPVVSPEDDDVPERYGSPKRAEGLGWKRLYAMPGSEQALNRD